MSDEQFKKTISIMYKDELDPNSAESTGISQSAPPSNKP